MLDTNVLKIIIQRVSSTTTNVVHTRRMYSDGQTDGRGRTPDKKSDFFSTQAPKVKMQHAHDTDSQLFVRISWGRCKILQIIKRMGEI